MITQKYEGIFQGLELSRKEPVAKNEAGSLSSYFIHIVRLSWVFIRKAFILMGRILTLVLEGPPERPAIPRIPS